MGVGITLDQTRCEEEPKKNLHWLTLAAQATRWLLLPWVPCANGWNRI